MADFNFFDYFEKNEDYDGMMEYLAEACLNITDDDNDPYYNAITSSFQNYIAGILSDSNKGVLSEASANKMKKIVDAFCKINAKRTIDQEKETRRWEQLLKNGELNEAAFIKNNRQKVRQLARNIVSQQTGYGKVMASMTSLYAVLTESMAQRVRKIPKDENPNETIFLSDYAEMKKPIVFVNMCKETFDDITDEEYLEPDFARNRMMSDLNKVADIELNYTDDKDMAKEGNEFEETYNKPLIKSYNQYNHSVANMSYEELLAEKNKIIETAANIKNGKEELAKLVTDFTEIHEKVMKADNINQNKDSEAYKILIRETKNATLYGQKECVIRRGGLNGIPLSSKGISIKSAESIIITLNEALDAFIKDYENKKDSLAGYDEMNELVTSLKEKTSNLKERVKNINDKYYKENESELKDKLKVVTGYLKVNASQDKSIINVNDLIVENERKKDAVTHYTAHVKSINKALHHVISFFTKDQDSHKNPSSSYTNFKTELFKLSNMKVDETNPTEYLAQMKATLKASNTYYEKHTGASHPFTGWSDAGKERIYSAKLVSFILNSKIKRLENRITNSGLLCTALSPRAIMDELNNNTSTLREDIKNRKNDLIKERISNQIKQAEVKIKSNKTQNKDDIKDSLAIIVAANEVENAREKGNDLNSYDLLLRKDELLKTSKEFKDLLDNNSYESLTKLASLNNGKKLYINYIENAKVIADNKDPIISSDKAVKESKPAIVK
ncbi:MAG: hypothetical protein K5656_10420 [Lachnospiraceae bacterium]|nr:hypothetical protein [Lachnospiraceae bacterium]